MDKAIFKFESPKNESIYTYAPGSPERGKLVDELERLSKEQIEIPLIINGKEIRTGKTGKVVMPHDHRKTLAVYHQATDKEVKLAIKAALEAKIQWQGISWIERSSIMLRAAELLSERYRYLINAATMLGQGKSVYQAEIDAACETIDYLRFNVYFASEIYQLQPKSDHTQLNRIEYRPLEGFVFTVTPFNFTAIASNLNMSPVLMGNTTVWKPASTSLFSNYYLMKIFQEAGLPPGVVNFVPGSGSVIGNAAVNHPDLSGIHFTGSNGTFNNLWKMAAGNIGTYKSYPRIVGETGGKDFIFVHNSADPVEVATAMVRGGFEYQGQKCSAASRAYIPKYLWNKTKQHLLEMIEEIKVGGVEDMSNFMNAVIDEPSFDNIMRYIKKAKASREAKILAGGTGDKSKGYFIQPTVIEVTDPNFVTMREEIFGPVMSVFVYNDKDFEKTLRICDQTSPYALTGAVFSYDRYALVKACQILRYAAGNFYYNDKPTGAMVGLQPFGGARGSGTNDKAGGALNLTRWTSPRTIKETLVPARDFRYPFMNNE
ncbi:MAG: L-glutamate gamma-semialdehyde dehydrogenase [Planctomycetes bacterium]|nr:L-glutamate gamma-semialdehyde dehydrogenase [Planctomycetota bacterium]